MPVIDSGAVPEFVSVTVCAALVVPTVCDANVSDPGATVAIACAATPVPASATSCVLPATLPELSVNRSTAGREPAAVGANLTITVQLWPAASPMPPVQVPPART